ncbi:MAG: PEP-CTERM sorting domain-containing protein [Planctomycetales bacterium]|nr:PEP-CTERM sorting domain-containing protein [Planctomycetales bacterium]
MKRALILAAGLWLGVHSGIGASPAYAVTSFSWEGDTSGWAAGGFPGGVTLTPKSTADGAPSGAITDGSYALEAIHPNGSGWNEVASFFDDGAGDFIWDDIVANTTLELDVYVPADALAGANSPELIVRMVTFAGEVWHVEPLPTTGGSAHVVFDYASDPAFVPNPGGWGGFNLTTRDDDGVTVGGGSLSPLYFDNFRLHSGQVPEPSAVLLATVGVLGALRRRRQGPAASGVTVGPSCGV